MIATTFILLFFTLFAQNVRAENASVGNPAHVKVGVWLVNVEKVDLVANSYRLDFYIWFNFTSSDISLNEVRNFEFINGAPTMYEVTANETQGYSEYRVRGDFIQTFDFSQYPFETHELSVRLEHKKFDVSALVFEEDYTSNIEKTASVAGWNLGGFQTSVEEHSYGADTFSRFVFSINLQRPLLSSFIKSVLPVSIITAISLLALFMAPQNFAQRITLGVTTLLAATTFHLSMLSGIPPTGYLTFADRMMISVYAIFLYNLTSSVYIMRLVDFKKTDEALQIKSKTLRFLPILLIVLIAVQMVL